jgi:hypothetical protein
MDLVNIGINPSLDLQLPGGGRYQIRAAIRDENSSEIGSAYQYVDVPDFNESRITLLSGVNYFSRSATIILPYRRQLLSFHSASALLCWC